MKNNLRLFFREVLFKVKRSPHTFKEVLVSGETKRPEYRTVKDYTVYV